MSIVSVRFGYQLFITTLLGAFLLFSGWAAYRSMVRGTQVTDSEYYSKGLRYSETGAELTAAADLGWQLETVVNHREILLRLSDRNKSPVNAATGTLTLLSPHLEGKPSFPLQEGPAGTYRLSLPPGWRGETLLNLTLQRDKVRLSRRLLLNLQP